MNHPSSGATVQDIGTGFGHFVDDVLRGRSNKTILNSSVALAALEIGVPTEGDNFPASLTMAAINNRDIFSPVNWPVSWLAQEGIPHAIFDFSPENFTLFGLDFPDFWRQLQGQASEHHTPIYQQNVAESLGLPDLPYGEMAHLAHMGMALYDAGRTFQDLWKELGEHYQTRESSPLDDALNYVQRTGKILTHPDMLHTIAARGVMLTVMGLLHPLGPLVAIGVSYLCMHLVHSAFGVLDRNKEAIQKVENIPVLREIYNASGFKEWAERKEPAPAETDIVQADPFQEAELQPRQAVHQVECEGRAAQPSPSMPPLAVSA